MKRPYPTNVFPRGGKLYIKVKMPNGEWKPVATGLGLEQSAEAGELQRRTQDQLTSGVIDSFGPMTVGQWANKWMEKRKDDKTIVTASDDLSRIRNHLLGTALARMNITDVRPRHVRAWVHALRDSVGVPRTVRNIYGPVRIMFTDAVIEEVIAATPCVLRRGDLPAIVDKTPEWRPSAIFTRAEVETIIAATDVLPMDRVALYAMAFLTGTRAGENFAIRWRHYDTTLEPLGRIIVAGSYSTKLRREKSTKTQAVRKIPVHKALAKILAQWRLSGWQETYGRKPTDDDLIVPSRLDPERSRNGKAVLRQFHWDLETLGLRKRRLHDARRTFRSLCADDGGSERAIEWIVYGRKGSVSGRYDEPSWQALCEPVLTLKIRPRGGKVHSIDRGAERCRPKKVVKDAAI